jgi:hypothetical protein
LDKVLVDGAAASGVEVREGFGVDELIEEETALPGFVGTRRTARRGSSMRVSWSARMD